MTRQGCVPGIIDVAGDDPSAADYREAPTFYWTIALLDLGIGLPATIAGCLALRRGWGWGRKLIYAVAGGLALVGSAVGAMAITMHVMTSPIRRSAPPRAMTALGLVFAGLALVLYRPLIRSAT